MTFPNIDKIQKIVEDMKDMSIDDIGIIFVSLCQKKPGLATEVPRLVAQHYEAALKGERLLVSDLAYSLYQSKEGFLDKDPGLKAKAILNILKSKQFHIAPCEKELEAELLEIVKQNPGAVQYLELTKD